MTNEELQFALERYFSGDLDRVERRDFERALADDPEAAAAFDEAYDRRTEDAGLLALTSTSPDLDECLSPATLDAYVAGTLDPEARGWVDVHLDCPLCREEVLGRRATNEAPEAANDESARGAVWARRGLLLSGFAVAAAILLWPRRKPRYRGPGAFEDRVTPQLGLPNPARVRAKTPGLDVIHDASTQVYLEHSDAEASVYYAIGVSAPGGPVRWVAPASTNTGLAPNLVALKGEGRVVRPIDLSNAAEVWLVLSDRPLSLELVRGALQAPTGEGPWTLPASGTAQLSRWRVDAP